MLLFINIAYNLQAVPFLLKGGCTAKLCSLLSLCWKLALEWESEGFWTGLSCILPTLLKRKKQGGVHFAEKLRYPT